MVLGKRWLFSIGNGAEIRSLEMGRLCPAFDVPVIIYSICGLGITSCNTEHELFS